MGKDSKISWCDNTFNPWVGCCKISSGCKWCYAEREMTRKKRWENAWGPEVLTQRVVTSEEYWKMPYRWDKEVKESDKTGGEIKMPTPVVFCGSLCDVFEEHKDVAWARERLWEMIEATGNLIWVLLTKRPENINSMVPATWRMVPPENVWMGVSVENQETADRRIRELEFVNAEVKCVSYEPAIGPVRWDVEKHRVDWIKCGGESGANARPFLEVWGMMTEVWTKKNGVKFYMKQMGSVWANEYKRVHGDKFYVDPGSKGQNIETFPERLKVREFPVERYK